MRIKKKRPELPELHKGSLLVLKAPPYFTKEYLYEVTSAGEKLIRATLFHSPTVKKSWSREELLALFEHGIVRLAEDKDKTSLLSASAESTASSQLQPIDQSLETAAVDNDSVD